MSLKVHQSLGVYVSLYRSMSNNLEIFSVLGNISVFLEVCHYLWKMSVSLYYVNAFGSMSVSLEYVGVFGSMSVSFSPAPFQNVATTNSSLSSFFLPIHLLDSLSLSLWHCTWPLCNSISVSHFSEDKTAAAVKYFKILIDLMGKCDAFSLMTSFDWHLFLKPYTDCPNIVFTTFVRYKKSQMRYTNSGVCHFTEKLSKFSWIPSFVKFSYLHVFWDFIPSFYPPPPNRSQRVQRKKNRVLSGLFKHIWRMHWTKV